MVSLGESQAELAGIFAEFLTAERILRRKTIRVVTEPVVLEDVDLGAFLIELDLKSGEELPYSVLTIEPHPAANAEAVTHSHGQGNGLCEGEGALPIRRALEAGRVFDFFQIVVQLLNTYDAENAYVKLEEWEGVSCSTCGAAASREEHRCGSASGDLLYREYVLDFSLDLGHDAALAMSNFVTVAWTAKTVTPAGERPESNVRCRDFNRNRDVAAAEDVRLPSKTVFIAAGDMMGQG